MEGEKKRQPETLIHTFNQVQRFNLGMYWQTLRPLQNLNSIFHTVKTKPRVSRITSPNKNLACEKAIIVILAMQVARFSAHGNIWGESGRGLPGIWYYYQCQTPSWPITGSRCSRAGTFPREKNACAQALIMGPSHTLTRTTTAFHSGHMVLKLYSPLKTSRVWLVSLIHNRFTSHKKISLASLVLYPNWNVYSHILITSIKDNVSALCEEVRC